MADEYEDAAAAPAFAATAFAARCVLRAARWASLSTQSEGQPFASLVTPCVAADGAVLMLLSALSAHSRHLLAEPRCAVLAVGTADGPNPQTAPRVTVLGRAEICAEAALRDYWVARHPYAALYAGFTDFSLWRIAPERGHYVAGFGAAHELPREALMPPRMAVAALQAASARIVRHCNDDHAAALDQLARAAGASGRWRMLDVDTDGFDLVQDDSVLRIAFDRPVRDPAEVRSALVRLVQAAQAGGP
jgi:putative heme iron utilization protein